MAGLGWLHVTDLHRGMSFQGCLWPNIEQQFFADLELLHRRSGPWHVLFFSGDLVQKGSRAEYRKFDETLTRLYKRLNELGSNPVLVAVPGNHDLVRPDPKDAAVAELGNWSADPRVSQAFWSEPSCQTRRLVKQVFRNYTRWERSHGFPRPLNVRHGALPGDFSATVAAGDIHVGVVGLNSAFLQLTNGNYEGKVSVSIEQLRATCGEHFTDWLESHTCCFLMTHHPPQWLDAESRQECAGEIAIPGRFVAHLCGHMHDPLNLSQSFGGALDQRLWQGPSIFGLELTGNGIERRHGYGAGTLVVAGQTAGVRLWPRLAQRHQAGHWHFIREPSASLEQDDGTAVREIPVNAVIASPHARKEVFKVLLLSTDTDLAPTRKAVAEHLRRSLGIDVSDDAGGARQDYHVVILIQGMWWGGGQAASLWQQTDAARRVAFVSDETADWPPYRFIEIGAHEQVATLRRDLGDAIHRFVKPEQLPELVGAVVTERLQGLAGAQGAGLQSWERRYLEFRIPAWRSGRTALSQPHLFDAADAKELYQPDLYTGLHGIAANWECSRTGQPIKSEPKPRKKSQIGQVDRRVKLAKWVTVPELPRVALVGAPGGGKTIFLTRIAAAIGSACLGRPVEFEPDLDIEKLRADARLPVPVVIEATRIAQRDLSSLSALLEVIADEMASAGTQRPAAESIESGLDEGRYFVLIDALDEIADGTKRSKTLTLLKSVAGRFPRTRIFLTTRSARYTGRLRFGPELESVEIAPLDQPQIDQLCTNWSRHRQRDEEYTTGLMSAVLDLASKVGQGQQDQALTENPLMLTAICMVFERYRSLPDDRGRLCELLIDDLCQSRQSEDLERKWKLDEAGKKGLLQRIALAMQEQGAQSWLFEKAVDIAMQLVPKTDEVPRERAKRYVDWAADHTGILRFQEAPNDQEQIRFWHRLFREYLSANHIAQEDNTAEQKISKLWDNGRLTDPFWEDVIRLLPRALGTIEKARSLRERLESLARDHSDHRGRLLGLAAAGIIENRDLFPDVDFAQVAQSMASVYEAEGDSWPVSDRLLFLDSLGRLDSSGDPRLHRDRWIQIKSSSAFVIHHGDPPAEVDLAFSWAPVTAQELYKFVKATDYTDPDHWIDSPPSDPPNSERLRLRTQQQLRHPNRPMVFIGFYEALAYCRWRTKKRSDGRIVRLPLSSEWRRFETTSVVKDLQNTKGKNHPSVDRMQVNSHEAGLLHPSPVGAFPMKICGACDVLGNVWEWLLPERTDRPRSRRTPGDGFPVAGGAFDTEPAHLGPAYPPWDFAIEGYPSIGFRCVLSSDSVNISKQIGDYERMLKET